MLSIQMARTLGVAKINIYQGISFKVLRPSAPNYWKMLNGYLMFSVKNIVQNVKLIELWGNNLVPLHFVISKSSFSDFSHRAQC